MNSTVSSQEVLDYWFGAPSSAELGTPQSFWFVKSEATDALMRTRFGATVASGLEGKLDAWQRDARGGLALIIVLDQFARNIFRDTARAFAGDAQALQLARNMVRHGLDSSLAPVERSFVYLPFEHDESMTSQRESLRLFGELAQAGWNDPLIWARKHAQIIDRFGRFPHRNEILGRTSTAAEIEFLKQPGSRF